ncbi:elongator complex protein 1 isoform X1 [Temnothorax americanus]|uniref:elongator complex protein 1 isoform X1 n=1 Tax=Temnothorax americanus TaxID=1964332 RepID=UPI0040687FB2
MRNLTVHQVCRRNIDFMSDVKDLQESLHCAINSSNNDLYLLLHNHLYVIPFEGDIIDLDIGPSLKIVSMEYCTTLQELYCAYEFGDVVKIDIKDPTRIDQNTVGIFGNGLQRMKFSPDHELVVVVTGEGDVITMVLDFQVISEVNLYSEKFGQYEFFNVGWGKKETQFHGSMGKAAARAEPLELIPNEHDDGGTRICWREDGAFFTVSFLHKKTKIRGFKVFNREGILCYTNEPVNGLEECLAWSPLGNLLAVTQTAYDKYVIAFFEKNGLKYSEFLLPFKFGEVKVKDLLWSPDILAVVCHESKTNTKLIQLWTENNCHWYLKQTLVFNEANPLLYVTWSNVTNKKELIYLTKKEITFCSFNWCLDHSRGKTVDDIAVSGVIDGSKILVTAFKDGVVPPPMAHQSLETHESQNAIIFGPNINKSALINSNNFFTISCNNKLTVFKQKKNASTLTYVTANVCSISCDVLYVIEDKALKIDDRDCFMQHFLWFTEDITLFSIVTKNHNLLCVLSLNGMHSNDCLKIREIHVMDYPIEHIVSSPDANTAYIKVRDRIFKYTRNGKLEQTDITLSEQCEQIEVIQIDSKDIILALSMENSFLVDGKEIAKNITSFYIHSDFLLLTTLQCTLICVLLNEVNIRQLSERDLTIQPWDLNMNEILFAGIYVRRLEKGSRIITAIPYDSKVILQLPRGNLECIQPRALSVHILKCYLNNCDYLTALAIMTKQRINLNLLYDHDPQLFMDNVKKFVEDLVQHKKLNWLNLFLSELQNVDVTHTMYTFCYADRPVKSDARSNETTINKVDEICKLLRDAMEKHRDADNLIQPILISLVKNQQRQGLENALSKIKQVKMLEDSQRSELRDSTVSAHGALKCLLHFVTIDTLYDVALGMYDLELAKFIASESSKEDPKEYIPFLNNLKKLDPNYMKYSINVHLKRYELALENLSKDPTKFEECLNLIRNHKLYKAAIKLFEKNTTEYKKVAEVYGEFLSSEGKYVEAGMMFYRSGDLDKAVETFNMSSDNWEDVIAISREMKLSPANSHKLYNALVERLKAERKYKHAAIILKEYLNDAEEAVALLCEGRSWKYAIRIISDVRRLDLNETHIKPGVKEHAEHVISQLSKMKEDFLKYKSRLAIVRTEIKAKQTQIQLSHEKTYGDEPESNKEIPDCISDTISIAESVSSRISRMSASSSKSYRSSKNRRKQERKLFSLKEGSRFEDLSLIHALYQIVSNAYKDRDDWYQLVQVLIRFEFDESAEKIIVETREFFQLVESSKSEIWDRSAPTSSADIEKSENYTQAQFQEMIAPIKLIERYIMYPPEVDATSRVLSIF